MLTWYQSKVKYEIEANEKRKMISELYLYEAVNFGDVELQCYEHLKSRIKDPDVDAINKAPFSAVVFYSGTTDEWLTDPFYRIGIKWGDDKDLYLIPARDPEQAIERALKYHGSAEKIHVNEIKKTEILAVWHPHNELWQGDWHNRMERLKLAHKHSPDYNQTEMFDTDGKANQEGSTAKTDARRTKKSVTITFRKHNGDPVDA
ncbi:DUF4494 family protein [Spirosoma radiotolerans]|uniref:Uncharacterized protein n=1 Tax=Spirosoma radiotolerans TaxID=1379870 RepID=A0A0E3ZUA2_9BACT|nr:DUF4494 family protein [Spirosoma radiotolerans]AKD55053.1 hypothetical protein SD10_09180 [Spirosoma radiotolerans]